MGGLGADGRKESSPVFPEERLDSLETANIYSVNSALPLPGIFQKRKIKILHKISKSGLWNDDSFETN